MTGTAVTTWRWRLAVPWSLGTDSIGGVRSIGRQRWIPVEPRAAETHPRSRSETTRAPRARRLDGLSVKLDGKPAAASTVLRKRAVFYNALGFAVEFGHLPSNPVDRLQWTAPEVAQAIDRRVVANPQQVAALLAAARRLGNRASRVVAFFGCVYYAGLRPAEAANLREVDCDLPETGWGKVTVAETDSRAGRHWTDDGSTHQRRGLKHRGRRETRTVAIPPVLVDLLRWHRGAFGLAPDGRFFRGLHGSPLSESVYDRWWKSARNAALSPGQVESPLARRVYDLRHAAASLWLNAGVPPTEVAQRLGHSVAVLLKVYANCIDGDDSGHNGRIGRALGDV
jgi:integrase